MVGRAHTDIQIDIVLHAYVGLAQAHLNYYMPQGVTGLH